MEKRTAILVDGANNYAAAKALGFSVDYDKLLKLERFGHILRPYYFTALPPKDEHSTLRGLVDHLEYNGWTVIQKPTKTWINVDGPNKIKGNMDAELILTAVDLVLLNSPGITDVALFSGDGDFRCLVEWMQRRGVRVTVFSTKVSTPPMVADEIRRQADEFVDLNTIRPEIVRLTDAKPVPARAFSSTFLKKGAAA